MYEAADNATIEMKDSLSLPDKQVPDRQAGKPTEVRNTRRNEGLAERLRALQAFSAA